MKTLTIPLTIPKKDRVNVMEFINSMYEEGKSENTLRSARSALEIFQVWLGTSLLNVNSGTLRAYVEYRKKEGRAAGTIKLDIIYIQKFYRFLDAESIKSMPFRMLKHTDRSERKKIVPYSNKERAEIIERAKKIGPKTTLWTMLMMGAGLRIGEVAALRVGDIDFINQKIITPKLKGRCRILGINPRLNEKLFSLIQYYMYKYNIAVGYLFPDEKDPNEHIPNHMIFNILKRRVLKRGHPHMLRHTAAWTVYNLTNKDIIAVRDFLGHTNVATTSGYLNQIEEDIPRNSVMMPVV